MEYYEIFMKVILKEVSKLNLNIDVYSTHIAQLTAALDENFDIPYNRCAFMYRYGTILTHFFNDCINIFFASYSPTKDIFSMWKSYSKVKVCSLSTGPGLDFIGFMLAVLEYDSSPPNFEVVVLSKHGAWQNTRKLILEVFNDPVSGSEFSKKPLQYQNLSVVQLDFLQNHSFGNVTAASEANVILMMKPLNLMAPGTSQEGRKFQMFKEFVASLKPETIMFCIDTKPSIAVLTKAILHFPGKFLYGPSLHTAQLPATFPEFNGHHPTLSARGVFFVWQKSADSLSSKVSAINTSIGKSNDSLIGADNSFNKSNASSVENVSNIDVKDSDNVNLPWMELKSFWECSSPKTKEVLKKLMITGKESLEQINDLMSQKQKSDTSKENSLKTFKNLAVGDSKTSKKEVCLNTTEEVRFECTQTISASSQSELHDDLSMNNQKSTFNNNYDMYSYTNESHSSSNSSFTCENKQFEEILSSRKNTSSGQFSSVGLDKMPILGDFQELDEENSKKTVRSKEKLEPFLSLENKAIQTDSLLGRTKAQPSVKALTDRIRQLAISLDSASQQNETSKSSSGDFSAFNQHNEGADNHTHSTDKPSCSKQSHIGFKEQDSLPSHHSCRNAPCQNMDSHSSCQCFHNRCMNCCFQPCCTQPIPRCSFSCHHHSGENNLANVTSPNIVIPLQNISDNTLLQIISILKSESKT